MKKGACLIATIFMFYMNIVGATDPDERVGSADVLRVCAVGDVMLGGTAGPELRQLGYDYPFVHVGPVLRRGHVVFGNLEGPLTRRGQAEQDKKYVFRSPPDKVVPALKAAGFTVFSLANNHSLDYGPDGLADTVAALTDAGIQSAGAGTDSLAARRPAFLNVEGFKVALLAYSLTLPENFFAGPAKPGTAFGHEQHMRTDVASARQQADIVLVSFHWGQEGRTELRDYQMRLGRAAIDAGADAVLGHHPHILQGVERYKKGVILYSLGNFVFGSYSKTATRSAIAQLAFSRSESGPVLSAVELVPINVDNTQLNFQPQLLTSVEANVVVETLRELSAQFGTRVENREGIAVVMLD